MPILSRIVVLALGPDVETGKLQRVAEDVADAGKLVAAGIADADQQRIAIRRNP